MTVTAATPKKSLIWTEVDYEREARNQQAFADYYRGHPFIRIPEVVPDGEAGLLVPPRDPAALAEAREGAEGLYALTPEVLQA